MNKITWSRAERAAMIMASLAALAAAMIIGHNARWYGLPWQANAPEPVACLRPAPDGPVTVPATGNLAAMQAWPAVCWQTLEGRPLNSGVALSLWGPYCLGVEWRGTPGPFWHLPIVNGPADC